MFWPASTSVPPPTLVWSPAPVMKDVGVAPLLKKVETWVSVPPSTPIVAAVFSRMVPERVKLPVTFSTAPLPPTPLPLRTSGRLTVAEAADRVVDWSCRLAPLATAT